MPREILDFSLHTDVERLNYINERLATLGRKPTQKELDLFANYVLFGKDASTDLSVVDTGHVQIATKYKSYARKESKVVSLDELCESPTFDERTVHPLKRSIYKTPRQELDKTRPELEPLRAEIDRLQHKYDAASGKIEDPSIAPMTSTELYHLKHLIISLRSQQYIVKDSVARTVDIRPSSHYTAAPDLEIEVWPLGFKIGNETRFTNPRFDNDNWFDTYGDPLVPPDQVIDFTNPLHIKKLIDSYEDLTEAALRDGTSDAALLVSTLDWYEHEAHLPPIRHDIYRYKTHKWPNAAIRERVNADHGTTYNENYISTIFTHDVCTKIAEAARQHYTRWTKRHDATAWKRCPTCGEWKLRSEADFAHRASSADGFALNCKVCEKQKRMARKEAKKQKS